VYGAVAPEAVQVALKDVPEESTLLEGPVVQLNVSANGRTVMLIADDSQPDSKKHSVTVML